MAADTKTADTDIHGRTKGSSAVKWLLIGISVLFLFIMLVLPLFTVISEAFRKGFAAYAETIADDDTISAVLLTLEATVIAVVINTVLRTFCGVGGNEIPLQGQKLLVTLIDLP